MNRSVLLVAALVLALPLALAHDPVGTPKNYCEPLSEWSIHDYAPPAYGQFITLGVEGNSAGDCNGDTVPADHDGHTEWATGGAWLLSDSGDGVTYGSIMCFGEFGHHPVFGPIEVSDIVLGSTVPFHVGADTDDFSGVGPCGDGSDDIGTTCVSPCTVTFPPGLDGSYHVYPGEATSGVVATQGHIFT